MKLATFFSSSITRIRTPCVVRLPAAVRPTPPANGSAILRSRPSARLAPAARADKVLRDDARDLDAGVGGGLSGGAAPQIISETVTARPPIAVAEAPLSRT